METITQLVNSLTGLAHNPVFWYVIVAILLYWVFASAVGEMPMPDATSSKAYTFWFKFLNHLAGNVARALKAAHLQAIADDKAEANDKAEAKTQGG